MYASGKVQQDINEGTRSVHNCNIDSGSKTSFNNASIWSMCVAHVHVCNAPSPTAGNVVHLQHTEMKTQMHKCACTSTCTHTLYVLCIQNAVKVTTWGKISHNNTKLQYNTNHSSKELNVLDFTDCYTASVQKFFHRTRIMSITLGQSVFHRP